MSDYQSWTEAQLEAWIHSEAETQPAKRVAEAVRVLWEKRFARMAEQMELQRRATLAAEKAAEAAKGSARSAFWAAIGGVISALAGLATAGIAAGAV